MKVIDLLNKIANGEELPKRIKYKCDIYKIGEDTCNKDVKYIDENKDDDGYTKYLFQDWILDVILNDEVEILDEEDEFEDIKPLVLKTFERTGQAVTIDRLADYYFDNFKLIEDTLAKVILNQKKIIDKLNKQNI